MASLQIILYKFLQYIKQAYTITVTTELNATVHFRCLTFSFRKIRINFLIRIPINKLKPNKTAAESYLAMVQTGVSS